MGIIGRDFAQFNCFVEIGANFRLCTPQCIRQQVFENGAVPAQSGNVCDAPAHRAGADDRDGLDLHHYYFLSSWVSTSFRLVPAPRNDSDRRLRSSASSVGTNALMRRNVVVMSST